MKRLISLGAMAVIGLAASACDKSSSSDPATVTRDELNPPRGLITVTGDKKVELRWTAGNAEEEFKGFQVFAVKKTLDEVQKAGVKYPSTTTKLATSSIPRCADNTAVFELFGIPASTADCEGDTEGDAAKAGASSAMFLADDEASAKLAGMVACGEGSYAGKDKATTTAKVSMQITGQALGEYRCVVTKGSAGEELTNGDTYTFFVAAVMGDEFNKLSWTSNFVEDTPATPLFEGEFTMKAIQTPGEVGSVAILPGAKLSAVTPFVVADVKQASCKAYQNSQIANDSMTSSACSINRTNDLPGIEAGIYFGRQGNGTYPQRIFVSVPKADTAKISILPRGPQTYDPVAGNEVVSTSIPNDQALATATFNQGTLYPVYGNQVFDLKVVDDSNKTRYGKLVIDMPKFDAAATAKETADITLKVKVVMQPAVDNPHYFW